MREFATIHRSMAKQSKKQLTSYSFPKDFLWGASTAGHQVEGGNFDQWTVWELDNAAEMARSAPERLRWLPEWLDIRDKAEDPENYVAGKAVDHIRRYKEDFKIIKKLNLNAFRFSIEWSRLEPEQGVWDKKAFDHYHNYIAELHANGIEPVMTLWHWTQPVWFDDIGGFGKRGNVAHFERFVNKVAEEFGDEVRYILILNEPNIYISYKELNGGVNVPPQQSALRRFMSLFWLIRAHKRAYGILKSHNNNLWVSSAYQMTHNVPRRNTWSNRLAVWLANYFMNYFFYDRVKNYCDFIGFNFYFVNYFSGKALINGFKPENPSKPTNDLGWYMEPSAIGDVAVKAWLRYKKPLMVTENGLADSEDKHRQWWIDETMQALMTARQAGADIFGYMHWSLMDNFEWAHGWWPKFGLIKVDRERDNKRLVRPSAVWWAKTLKRIRHEDE